MLYLKFYRFVFGIIFLFFWANSQETNAVCRLLSNSSALISLNENFVISSTIVPARQTGSNYSNDVSVTSLSSSLIGKYGDSYAIALIGISNQAVQWESITDSGSSSSLPTVSETFQSLSEIQFDNRFGFFHFDANFNFSFPENIVLLSPTDRIRFRILTESNGSADFSSCRGESVAFVFFDVGSSGSQLLQMIQNVKTQLVSLSCQKWPFSTLVFRICPDLRIDSDIFTSTPVKKSASTDFSRFISSLDTTVGEFRSNSALDFQSTSNVVSTSTSVLTTTETPNTKVSVIFSPFKIFSIVETSTFPESLNTQFSESTTIIAITNTTNLTSSSSTSVVDNSSTFQVQSSSLFLSSSPKILTILKTDQISTTETKMTTTTPQSSTNVPSLTQIKFSSSLPGSSTLTMLPSISAIQTIPTTPLISSPTTVFSSTITNPTQSSTVQTLILTSTVGTDQSTTLLTSKTMPSSSVSTFLPLSSSFKPTLLSSSSFVSSSLSNTLKPTLLSSSPLLDLSSSTASNLALSSSFATTKISSSSVTSTVSSQSSSTTQVSATSQISLINCTKSSSDLCNSCSKDFLKKTCLIVVEPLIFDLTETKHDVEIQMNISKNLQEFEKIECFLKKNDGSFLTIQTDAKNNKIDVKFDAEFQENTFLFLFCSIDDEYVVVNQTLLIASFQSLVEHKTPFVSGFDKDQITHKSVLITFIEALPSSFSIDTNSGAVCVIDGKTGKKYPAKWKTPSIISCELDSTIPTGSVNIYTVRRKELENATFQFQSPVSITITANNDSTSTIVSSIKSAFLTMDLLGINVELGSNSGFFEKIFDCSKIFLGGHSFGDGAICSINGSVIFIQFGTNATILAVDPLLIRTGMLTQNLSNSLAENAIQYDVLTIIVPFEVISPQIQLIQQTQFLPCVNSVNFSVITLKGDGKRSLIIHWILQNGGTNDLKKLFSQSSNSFLTISKELIGSGATFFVEACNFAAKCSNSTPLTVNISEKTSDFSVTISGCPATPLPAYKIILEAEPFLMTCNQTIDLSNSNISYEWTINETIITHDDILTIVAFQYFANSMIVVGLKAKYWNSDIGGYMKDETSQIIQFGAESLMAIVDGTERTISVLTDLVMDARLSYDPNSGSRKLNHRWTCVTSKSLNCEKLNIDWSLKRIVIPANTLIAGEHYTFTDTVSNDLGATASVTVNINVVQANIPSIQLLPLSESSIPTNEFLRIQAYIQSSTNLTIRWSIIKLSTNQTINISSLPNVDQILEPDSSDSMYALSFTLPPHNESQYKSWSGLESGKYLLRLTARNTDGSASTDLKFQIIPKPAKPSLQATPLKDITALQTVMKLEAGVNDSATNSGLYRFGVRTILVGNQSEETWFRQSAIQNYKTILASAWPEPHAACNRRVGYQGMLQLCDLAGACTQTETDQFVVQHPLNLSFILEHVLNDVMTDMTSGDIESALQKIRAIQQEQCNTTINTSIADVMIEKTLQDLQNTTNSDELLNGVGICTSIISSASSSKVIKVMDLLARAQTALKGVSIEDRKKRNAADSISAMANLMTSGSPEANADAMLQAFDMTVQTNLDISTAYINNLLEQLSTFCKSVDSSRVMTAQGKDYTKIQAEGLTPNVVNFLNTSFSIALNVQNAIKFNNGFVQYFKNYKCGQNKLITCTDVCLATAETKKQILADNGYIKSYFFPTDFNAATYNNLVSDFHYILFEDTQLGQTVSLSNGINYTVYVSLNSYIISNYYSCFVYSKKYWDNSVCNSDEYATKSATNGYILGCTCTTAGIVAVFTMNSPVPPSYPPHNEILLTFNLSTTMACSAVQMSQFVSAISTSTTITVNRFQNISCNAGTDIQTNPATIVAFLRPPFKEGQIDNSHAIQSIKRSVGVTGGFVVYSKVMITGVDAVTVNRTLQNDGRARKIPLKINKSFRDVVGNDTDGIIQKWTKSVATTIGVDIYRIKNAIVADGIIFNFTITLPYETSSTTEPMSAEELSLLIMEQTRYKELEFYDNNDQLMPIDSLAFTNIVQLAVNSPTNSLMTILAIVVSTILFLSSAYVGSLVVIKIRTDRLIEAHNQNLRTIDITPNEPFHVVPFESNGMIWRNGIVTKEMDKAADTVVFGRQPVRTRHR